MSYFLDLLVFLEWCYCHFVCWISSYFYFDLIHFFHFFYVCCRDDCYFDDCHFEFDFDLIGDFFEIVVYFDYFVLTIVIWMVI